MQAFYLEQAGKVSLYEDRIIVIDIFIKAKCMTLLKGSIVALLLCDYKFQAFIFLSENKSPAKITSEHDLHKPVTEQALPELCLFLTVGQ